MAATEGQKPERVVRRGEALDWTEEQWDQAAEISPTDVEQARAEWKRDAPPGMGGLLDAEPEEVPE